MDPNQVDINNKDKTQPFKQKIYFGNFQERSRRSGDKFLMGILNLTKLLNELGYEVVKKAETTPDSIHVSKKGEEFLKVVINPYLNGANEHGNTHSICVDKIRSEDTMLFGAKKST